MASVAATAAPADTPFLRAVRERSFDGRAAWIWTLAFALILYLGLKSGGYDLVVRSEAAIAVWWIVLLGGLAGVLPGMRIGRRAWVAVGLLAAFTAWSALASAWTISTELTVDEVSRLVAYCGVLILAVATFGDRGAALRHVVGAVGSAIAVIAVLALLSRLRPGLFPGSGATAALLPGTQRRLSWPLDYWNALAAFMALGLPLLLATATSARRTVARAAAAAAMPVLVLCIYFAFSRAGALAGIVGTVAFLVLTPERLSKLLVAIIGAIGAAALVALAASRHAVAAGLTDSAARHQGTTLLVATVVVCAAVAALTALSEGTIRRARIPRAVRPSIAPYIGGGLAAVIVAAFVVLGGPGKLSHAWHDFKQPPTSTLRQNAIGRFGSLNGNGRYLYWQAAIRGLHGHWVAGSGPGTYPYIWEQRATTSDWIRNAHSLYIETLSDTGIVGLGLLVAFLLAVLLAAFRARGPDREAASPDADGPGEPGAARAVRAARVAGAGVAGGERAAAAAVAASVLAFLVSAALDWVWQVPVLPVALLLLGGAALAPSRARQVRPAPPRLPARLALAAVAVLAIVAVAIPLAATTAVRSSQAAVARGDLSAALADARTAIRVESGAGTPHLQAALVLELEGDIPAAVAEARAATTADARNAEAWLVRSRLESEDGQAGEAVLSFRRARALDKISLLTRL